MKTFLISFINLFFDILGYVFFRLPRPFVRWLGAGLGVLWFDILRFRRKIVLENLDLAFPHWSKEQKIRVGRKSVYQLGSQFAEFFTIPFLNQAWLSQSTVITGEEHLQKALAQNKGVFLLSMHLGHGDVGVSLISMSGHPVYVISKVFKTKWFNDLWFRIRKGQGVQFIEPHGSGTPFAILKALKSNACVVFVLDQFMGKPFGVETSFFGHKTGTAYGLALFYLKTKSPVVPVYTYEGDDGRVHLVYEPALELASFVSEDQNTSIQLMTQYFTDQIENCVRKYPEQWMWVHRRWKSFD
jgi:KDO2-lipid IV(A) lauroyltransferase